MALRILWFSNAPWAPTGYGMQTAQAWWRIQKLGHTIPAIGCNYGHEGMPIGFGAGGEQTQVWGKGMHPAGNDIIAAQAQACKADIVITLYDTWIFNPQITAQIKWCPWMPADHDPLPPAIAEAMKGAFVPIAFAQFGVDSSRPLLIAASSRCRVCSFCAALGSMNPSSVQ